MISMTSRAVSVTSCDHCSSDISVFSANEIMIHIILLLIRTLTLILNYQRDKQCNKMPKVFAWGETPGGHAGWRGWRDNDSWQTDKQLTGLKSCSRQVFVSLALSNCTAILPNEQIDATVPLPNSSWVTDPPSLRRRSTPPINHRAATALSTSDSWQWQTDKQIDTDRHRDKQRVTDRQTDRETDKHRETDTETDTVLRRPCQRQNPDNDRQTYR